MRFETPFKKALGLGSVKTGVHHWWWQRITALALIPCSVWVAFSVAGLVGEDYAVVVAWFKEPFTAVLLSLFVLLAVVHASLGLQVVIEDYVHHPLLRIVVLLLLKALLIVAGAFSIITVLRLFLVS